MSSAKKWIKPILYHPATSWVAAFLLLAILRLIWLTCHKHHINPPKWRKKQRDKQPVILVLWHEYIPFILAQLPPDMATLNSSHGDARIVGMASQIVGAKPVWGSSNRNPIASLRNLAKEMAVGRHVLLTPDGPRGPAHKMAQGPVALAQLTGKPIVFFACHASSKWRLSSWDKTQFPKPFSSVTISWSDPIAIGKLKGKDEQAQALADLEQRLIAFCQQADPSCQKKDKKSQ